LTYQTNGVWISILNIAKLPLCKVRNHFSVIVFIFTFSLVSPIKLLADPIQTPPPSVEAAASSSTRYGFFNWLDHRSAYNQDAFPEPFLVDDSALEVNEARLDWLHTQANHQYNNLMTTEIEKGFGVVTLEAEIPYESDTATNSQNTKNGFNNVNLGARLPVYQYVSDHKFFDTTFGTALEVGIPTHSSLSKDTEVVPKIFNDLKLGEHFTLQSIFGYSKLFGNDADGGLETFEYGFVFGYTIQHEEFPISDVLQLIPIFELIGTTQLNKDTPGHNSLLGNAGFRVNLQAVGQVQPRLGLGYVFPIDNGGSENLHWGFITSLVFEY